MLDVLTWSGRRPHLAVFQFHLFAYQIVRADGVFLGEFGLFQVLLLINQI